MVERVQGFFRLKLKLKRCVSHLFFFFFLLEFLPVLAPVQPESAYFNDFRQYDPIQAKSGNEKKKKKCGTNMQAATSLATHCVIRRCSTPVATSVLQRLFPLCSSYTIWSQVDCDPTHFVLATVPTHLCFSIQPSKLPPFCFLLQSNPIMCTENSLILQGQQQEDSLYKECLCSSIQVEIPPLLPILLL